MSREDDWLNIKVGDKLKMLNPEHYGYKESDIFTVEGILVSHSGLVRRVTLNPSGNVWVVYKHDFKKVNLKLSELMEAV